ncbi:MAG TPA: hypothetical protein VK543_14545 [Puia sp.]|nr:hypothetical protein [Puia sp.]
MSSIANVNAFTNGEIAYISWVLNKMIPGCLGLELTRIYPDNPGLVRAFALHVLDIFEHYRFRAVQAELEAQHKKKWDGFLSLDDTWLTKAMASGGKGDLAEYIAG